MAVVVILESFDLIGSDMSAVLMIPLIYIYIFFGAVVQLAAFLGMLLTLMSSVALLPFGHEFARTFLWLLVSVESTPAGTWCLHQFPVDVQPDMSWHGLRHSSPYDDDRVLDLISKWLTSADEKELRI